MANGYIYSRGSGEKRNPEKEHQGQDGQGQRDAVVADPFTLQLLQFPFFRTAFDAGSAEVPGVQLDIAQ